MAEHDLNKIVDNSGEVFNLRDNTKQPTADRVTSWSSTTSDTKYPSEKLVKDSLDGKLSYLDATYIRNNAAGDGWVKLANIATAYHSTVDIFGVWDVVLCAAAGGIWRDSVTLNVRFGSGGSLPSILLFNRLCEITNKTSQFEMCVKVEGLGGSGNSTVELWAKVPKGWNCIGIREAGASGASSLSKKLFWEYHSYTTDGGSSKPVADAQNNIQVKDPDIYSRDALVQKVEFTQPAEYKSFVIIEDVTRWYDPAGTAAISKGYQLIGQIAYWRSGGGYESMAVAFIKFHLNYRWQLTNDSCCEVKSTLPNNSFCPMIIKDARDENNVKYYFGLRTKIAWNSTVQFIGRTRDLSFSNLEWIPGENAAHTGNGVEFPVGITIERNCDLLEWNSIANGGTGATTAIGAEYNILNQVQDVNTTLSDDRKIALCNQTKSASNGVFRWIKLSNVWTYFKDKISSVLGLSESGYTGNAATATALASGGADRTKLDGIAAGAEVNVQSDWNQTTTTADDYIKNKPTTMPPSAHVHNTDANEVTANDAASELNVVTDTTEIVTTNTGGYSSSDKKLYRRPAGSKIWPWIKGKLTSDSGVDISGNAATASDAKSGSTLATTITGKLNTDGSNVAETWSDANINKVLKNLNTENQDFYSGDDFIASSHTDAGEKENKFTRRSSSKVLNWLFNNGQHSAQIGGDMKKFGWVMGDYAGNASLGGWHIAKTDISNSSGYGNCVFRALVVIDKFTERVTYNEYGYNENNFVGILDIYARMNSATVAVSNIKKIGRLTSFYPNATSSGSTGWAVFAKVNQSNYTIDWYIGRGGQSSLSVQDIFKYTKISIMPLQNNGSNTLYMDRVTSTIDCSTAPDDYWQMFKTPLISASDFGKGSSSLPVYITANANTFAPVDAQSTQGNFIRSLTAGSNIGASEYIAAAGASSGQWKYTFTQLLDWINGKNVMERSPASVGTINKRIQLGYGSYGNGKAGYCCYLVHFFFKEVAGTLIGKGVTVLVSYDWYGTTYQAAKCQILNDNGMSDAGYKIVIANFYTDSNTNLHICLGLVKTSSPTNLVNFTYTYCRIMRIAYGGDWTESVASDNETSYSHLIPAEFGKADSFSTSVNAGSANQPVYFNNGVPTVCNWWVS